MRTKYPQRGAPQTSTTSWRERLRRRIQQLQPKSPAGHERRSSTSSKNAKKDSAPVSRSESEDKKPQQRLTRKEQLELEVREVGFTSLKAFTRAHQIWGYLLISLAAEPLIVPYLTIAPMSWAGQLDTVLAVLITAAVPFFWHEKIWASYRRLMNMRKELFERYSSRLTWIGIAMVLIISILEVGVKFISVKSLWVVPILMLIVATMISHTIREQLRVSAEREKLERDPVAWVEQVNREAFMLSLAPLVLARIFALVALLRTALSGGELMDLLPYTGVALVLMVGTEPKQHDFMLPCKQCSLMTSIALQEKGYCLACSRERFVEKTPTTDKKGQNQEPASTASPTQPSKQPDPRNRR